MRRLILMAAFLLAVGLASGCVSSPPVEVTTEKNVTNNITFNGVEPVQDGESVAYRDVRVRVENDYEQASENALDVEQMIQDALKDIVPTLDISP